MRSKIATQTKALIDLEDIAFQIGQQNPKAALRFLEAAEKTFEKLAQFSTLGNAWESDEPALAGIKVWPVKGFKKYLIFFKSTDDGIEIVRVIYGGRDLPSRLQE